MRKVLVATAMALGVASGAQAADLAAPRTPIAAAVVAPAFSWTGFYVGGFLGGSNVRSFVAAPTLVGFDGTVNRTGVVIGALAGYNYQINSLVVGLEGELGWRFNNGSVLVGPGPDTRIDVRNDFNARIRGRLGVAIDRAHLYAAGGLSIGNQRLGLTNLLGPETFSGSKTLVGFNLGVGLEYAFTPNWVGRVEYIYDYYQRYTVTPPVFFAARRVATDEHTIRVGLSYLFSTGPSAVVARY
ncbi:MAG: outer membrane protein [Phreatobacter sp.]